MSNPIIKWAIGTCLMTAVSATISTQRISQLVASGLFQPAGQASAARGPGDPGPEPGRRTELGLSGRTLSINGDRNGHFQVQASVDGRRLAMLVDTGATLIVLTYEDAAAAGIRPFPSDFTHPVSTANGSVGVAAVRLREVRVGDLTVRDVEAVVMPSGRLGTSLLGMSFLRRLGGFDIADNRLTLRG